MFSSIIFLVSVAKFYMLNGYNGVFQSPTFKWKQSVMCVSVTYFMDIKSPDPDRHVVVVLRYSGGEEISLGELKKAADDSPVSNYSLKHNYFQNQSKRSETNVPQLDYSLKYITSNGCFVKLIRLCSKSVIRLLDYRTMGHVSYRLMFS